MKLLHKRDVNDYMCCFFPYFEEYNYADNVTDSDDDFILLNRRDGIIGSKSFGKVLHDNTIARVVVEIREVYPEPRKYYYQIIMPCLVATDEGGWGGLYQNIACTDYPLEEEELEQLLNNQGWYFLDSVYDR